MFGFEKFRQSKAMNMKEPEEAKKAREEAEHKQKEEAKKHQENPERKMSV